MPVIVNSQEPHPFLPSLGDPGAIEADRARHQDIRPMEIAIINLMADKMTTEKQLAAWLGHAPIQISLTFAAPDTYINDVRGGRETTNTPADHILKFYNGWSEIKDRKFDGLVVTGVNALKPTVGEEKMWPEIRKILAWSDTNVLSSLFLCWGAKAALKHFHDIESYRGEQKLFGLFEHRLTSDKTGLLFGLPDVFPAPVSRWKSPRREDILAHPELEIAADSKEAGPNMLVESSAYEDGEKLYARRVYILNHPEYGTDTLKREYERDRIGNPETPLPLHYFPGDDPAQMPVNSWRYTASIYSNWVKNIYGATPYDIANVPRPFLQQRPLARPIL